LNPAAILALQVSAGGYEVVLSLGSSHSNAMADLKLQVPVTEEVEVDATTLAAIDPGIKDAGEGRTVPIHEVRKMIPPYISKFKSQKPLVAPA
jgi:hypothetical protein